MTRSLRPAPPAPARSSPLRIPVCRPVLGAREERLVGQAVRSGFVSSRGPFVERFESGFAEYVGRREGIAVSSGTAALHLAFVALGLGPGDEVLVPAFSMIACPNSVRYTGARPVAVDAEPRTWNLDPEALEAARTPRTRAVLVVHTYGHPADLAPITEWARDRKLAVVEDAAEAHGAEYRGRRTGGFGELSCFSFYANKIITTGEGGMVLTDRPELAERLRRLRDQGFGGPRRFVHDLLGFNYRLTNVQAALGCAQLERIDRFVAARRRNARRYAARLRGVAGIELPPEAGWARSVYWMYSVRVRPDDRDRIARTLRDVHGIETRPFFYPIHRQPIYEGTVGRGPFPIADALSASGLNLPSSSDLTAAEIRTVSDALASVASEAPR